MQPELTMFTGDKTINDFLKPEDRALLESGLKARGIPLPLVTQDEALDDCQLRRPAGLRILGARRPVASFLDKKLAEDALRRARRSRVSKRWSSSFSAMDSLPVEMHLKALIETLAPARRCDDVMTTTTDL